MKGGGARVVDVYWRCGGPGAIWDVKLLDSRIKMSEFTFTWVSRHICNRCQGLLIKNVRMIRDVRMIENEGQMKTEIGEL